MEIKSNKLLCAQKNDGPSASPEVNCPCNCGGVLKGDGRSNNRTSLQCSKCNCYYVANDLALNIRLTTKYVKDSSIPPSKILVLNKAASLLARIGIKVIPYSPMWHILRKASEIIVKPALELKDLKHLEISVKELSVLLKEAEAIIKSFLPKEL